MDQVGDFFLCKEKKLFTVVCVFLSVDGDGEHRVHFYQFVNDCLVEYRIQDAFVASHGADCQWLPFVGFLVDLPILQGILEINVDHAWGNVHHFRVVFLEIMFNGIYPVDISFIGVLFQIPFLSFQPEIHIIAKCDLRIQIRGEECRRFFQIGILFFVFPDQGIGVALIVFYFQFGG